MEYQRVRRVAGSRLVVGLGVAIVLGVLSSALTLPFLEWFHGMISVPAEHENLGTVEFFGVAWRAFWVPFLVFYLLPATAADAVTGQGWRGVLGAGVFALTWWATASALQYASYLWTWLQLALAIILIFEFTIWIHRNSGERDREIEGKYEKHFGNR